MSDFRPGLEGVIAFETEIAEPDKEGGALRYRGVDTLVLTGVSTEGGILATARGAVELGFHPLVVEDAVGSIAPEGQAAGLALLRPIADLEASRALLGRLPAAPS